MNKNRTPKFFRNTKLFVKKHTPEILIGFGITGMVSATVMAVKATPKALANLEQVKEAEGKEKLTPVETIKATWRYYAPSAVLCVTSAGCILGGNSVNIRRNAAIATAYKLSESAFAEYKDKVIETIGEKKEQTVQEKVDKARVEKNPVSSKEVVITGKGTTLVMDYYSGRYFESDIDLLKKAVNQLSGNLLRNDYVSLNDLYDELGISRVGLGDEMGWNISRVGRDLIQTRISSQIADDGRPCIVFACAPSPQHGFEDYL